LGRFKASAILVFLAVLIGVATRPAFALDPVAITGNEAAIELTDRVDLYRNQG
jgi:hypothetical protein